MSDKAARVGTRFILSRLADHHICADPVAEEALALAVVEALKPGSHRPRSRRGHDRSRSSSLPSHHSIPAWMRRVMLSGAARQLDRFVREHPLADVLRRTRYGVIHGTPVDRSINPMTHSPEVAQVSAKSWTRILARYRMPSMRRSALEIAVTAGPLVGFLVAMWMSLQVSYWLSLGLAPFAAAFLVRLFLIEHDCSHDAYFQSRAGNDWVGRAIGVFTLTPYDYWRRTHAIHHATVGNLDQRGIGDVATMTVAEYASASGPAKLLYRLYRHPLVMFGLGPTWLFLFQYRLPIGLMKAGWRPWVSTMGTNAAAGLVVMGIAWWIGLVPLLLIQVPVFLIAWTIGVWLFYVQHQFEGTNWSAAPDWVHAEAALHGSSHYDLPLVLRWLTANIGLHHIHHLGSRIPFYRLPEVMCDHPELRDVGRVTLLQSLRCIPLVLWDESSGRLVSFRTARADAMSRSTN